MSAISIELYWIDLITFPLSWYKLHCPLSLKPNIRGINTSQQNGLKTKIPDWNLTSKLSDLFLRSALKETCTKVQQVRELLTRPFIP